MAFPFRYYGHQPGDVEGDVVFELAFVEEPTAAQKARLAAAWVAAGERGAWLWSKHVASFAVEGAEPTKLLEAVHAIAPVRQAILCGARDAGDSDWARWTVETQPVPDAGPAYDPPRDAPFGRPVDPELPVAAPDPAFDRAVAGHDAAATTSTTAVIETGRGLTLERVDDPALAARHGTAREDPRFDPPPADCEWLIPRGGAHGWLRGPDGACRGLALVGDDGRAHLVPGLRDGRAIFELADTGGLVVWQPDAAGRLRRVYRVSRDAEPALLWTAEADIRAIARVSDGWLVATLNQLVVLRDDGPRLAIASERRARPASWLATARGGELVLVGNDLDTEVWGYHDGSLTQLDALGERFRAPREIEGRVIFWAGNDAFELRGLDALLAGWQAKRKPARKPSKRAGAPALALERTDAALEPVVHTVPAGDATLAGDGRDVRVFASPASRRTVAIDDRMPGAALWLDAAGAVVREPGAWGSAAVAFSPSGDEVIAYQAGFARLLHVDLAASVATWHQLTEDHDRKSVRDAAALGGGRVLVLLAKALALRGPTGVLAELALPRCTKLHLVRADLAILACDTTGKKTRVVAIDGDRLVELDAFPDRLAAAGRIGDDVAIETVDGDRLVLRNVAEALAQATAPKPGRSRKAPAGADTATDPATATEAEAVVTVAADTAAAPVADADDEPAHDDLDHN